jgi:hypothetical protein
VIVISRAVRFVAFALVLAIAAPAFADEELIEPDHEHEHHHHENHVAVFVGGTTGLGDEGTTKVTIGADYEHRLPFLHEVGVGALVDSAVGSDTSTLLAGFIAVHPYEGLMVYGGAGVDVLNAFKEPHFAVRGAVAYFVPIGPMSAGPEISFDHVFVAGGENAIVYGLSAGMGF